MSMRWLAPICACLLLSGCRTPPLEAIDQAVADFATRPFDEAPVTFPKPADAAPPPGDAAPAPATAAGATPAAATTGRSGPGSRPEADDVVRTSFTQVEDAVPRPGPPQRQKFELRIPKEVPASETPLVTLPKDPAKRNEALAGLYPQLPALPAEPEPLPGPNGHPYSLAELQRLAAANSPALRQAAADVESARGLMIQAGMYPNPSVGYEIGPNNNNTATGTYAYFYDQVIKTGGKLKIQVASAQMALQNAELALKRARSDLATQVRTGYYNVVVARETVRVNRALANQTDEVFRLQADMLGGGFAAGHEPAALRAQAFNIRLGYKQAIATYVYAWKQLVATIGVPQLPLTEVEGRVDRLIPFYDYDAVLAHVLLNHTDILTARSNLQKARYDLKSAQVLPIPDVEFRADIWKETTILPKQHFLAGTITIPFPIWDQNKGNIRAASSALVRAGEGPHQVQVALTGGLANAYTAYMTNLASVEYYRRYILPDQVRYYRGVFERRKIDPNASFNDLVTAQQTLTASVSTYLGVLGQLWTSVVNVADFLQTDDLYQLATPMELPQLPDFDALNAWPCPHPVLVTPAPGPPPAAASAPNAAGPVPAAPAMPQALGEKTDNSAELWPSGPVAHASNDGPAAGASISELPLLAPPPFAPPSAADPPAPLSSALFAPDSPRRSSEAGSRRLP